ncbi:MAG TPA: D-alanyl-D-alanine carboxypeptidase family protein [Gaiellaceae bacterium]
MKGRLLVAVAAFWLVLAGAAHASPPRVDARSWIVANAADGTVLARHDAGVRVPIASITKLMTVLVALDHLRLNQVVTVSPFAASVGESSIGLDAGDRLTVRELLEGALIQSANDAADALASAAANGDVPRFVGWMNARARTLGLDDTYFVRPDGLDAPGHVSSARDVLRLAEIAMHRPVVREIVRERTATIAGGRVLHTWNDLLGVFPGLIGVKTGHTGAAGWCEVAAARRPGYTIYAVVLGSPTRSIRNAALASLLRWGVSRYRLASLIAAKRTYAVADPGWGRDRLALVAPRTLIRAHRVGVPLVERVVAPAVVTLPVSRGQVLGEVQVWEGSKLLGERPLVASRAIARPGFGGRVEWYAKRTLHHVLGFFS